MKFKVGDIVMCNVRGMYSITDVGVLCTVERVSRDIFEVSVDHYGNLRSFNVTPEHFVLVKRGEDELIMQLSSLDYMDNEELDHIDKLLIEEAIQNESKLR